MTVKILEKNVFFHSLMTILRIMVALLTLLMKLKDGVQLRPTEQGYISMVIGGTVHLIANQLEVFKILPEKNMMIMMICGKKKFV